MNENNMCNIAALCFHNEKNKCCYFEKSHDSFGLDKKCKHLNKMICYSKVAIANALLNNLKAITGKEIIMYDVNNPTKEKTNE